MVATGQVGNTTFTRKVNLRLGDFTRDESVRPGGNRRLEISLSASRAPSQFCYGFGRRIHNSDRPLQDALDMFYKNTCVLETTTICTGSEKTQTLFAEERICFEPESQTQLGIVSEFRVGIQRQVVGVQIDIVRKQQGEPLFHPSGNATILPAPEQPVMNKNRVGPGLDRGLDQSKAGRHSRNDLAHIAASLDLQAIGSIVPKFLRKQQGIESLGELFAVYHGK